ncbi:hypothetical protein Lal_00014634 [Lupinus albus]|nr:hypothetical protein Lal_00014634 [Lupinus albus]
MAKKVVATLQGGAGSKKMTKVIKMVKSPKTGAYVFEEKVMNADEVDGKSKVDDEVLDELEDILIASDVGVNTTVKIIERIEARVERDKYVNTAELDKILREEISGLLLENPHSQSKNIDETKKPYVIMVVGVNGVGKTTTIGKLAHQFKSQGLNVVLGAADTFRAAAVDQLVIWSERVGVPIVKQNMGSDPASVAFDTVQSAVAQNADVVIIDTAGRLHNKINLMNELSKIKRVMQKVLPEAPHEVLLVLDGSTGQNAFEQAKQFTAATEVSALAVTKLDGTAKGGVDWDGSGCCARKSSKRISSDAFPLPPGEFTLKTTAFTLSSSAKSLIYFTMNIAVIVSIENFSRSVQYGYFIIAITIVFKGNFVSHKRFYGSFEFSVSNNINANSVFFGKIFEKALLMASKMSISNVFFLLPKSKMLVSASV